MKCEAGFQGTLIPLYIPDLLSQVRMPNPSARAVSCSWLFCHGVFRLGGEYLFVENNPYSPWGFYSHQSVETPISIGQIQKTTGSSEIQGGQHNSRCLLRSVSRSSKQNVQVLWHYWMVIYMMCERKNWTQQEDGALLQLIQEFNTKKWSQIAKTMEMDYQIQGRTGKQCRERWHNNLNPIAKGQNWSSQDSTKLFEYHTIYGNRWAKIASLFGNRSDNSVKNHFYSTLRKAHRIINKYIKQHKRRLIQRPLKDSILSKIISLSQETTFSDRPQLIIKSKDLLGRLVDIAQSPFEEYSPATMEAAIADLLEINKAFKLKKINKRQRKPTGKECSPDQSSSSPTSQQQPKTPTQPFVQSPKSANDRKGFRLYDPNCLTSGSVSELASVYPPNQAGNQLNGVYLVYNNPCQVVFCSQAGFAPQDPFPQFACPPMWALTL